MATDDRIIGRYVVERLLGRGGMAAVYLARQPDLDRYVALKELAGLQGPDAGTAERFAREARLAAMLNHPNVVTVFETFEHEGVPYIAMEYLDRGSLRPYVGWLTLPTFAGVVEGLLAGLAHAHANGVVHRDLKPENVLVTTDGAVKIADFGVAKAMRQVFTAHLTATGMTIGTPVYMAPEQAMGQNIGPWTDLYAVGVMAYELIAGRPPFYSAEEPLAVLMQHLNTPVPPLAGIRKGIDARLSGWVERLLAKEPDQRFATAQAAWDALEDVVVEISGAVWRRDARLVDRDDSKPTVERPLTPAPFEDPTAAAASPQPPRLTLTPDMLATPPGAERTHTSPSPAPEPEPPATAPTAMSSSRTPEQQLAPAAPAAPATDGPTRARPPGRRRLAILGGGLGLVAAAAVAAVLVLGGGGGDGGDAAGAPTAGAPDCVKQLVEDLPGGAAAPQLDARLGPAEAAAGKTFGVVLGRPKAIGAVRFSYPEDSDEPVFVMDQVLDGRCRKLTPRVISGGEYPNVGSYANLHIELEGKPYKISPYREGGGLGFSLQTLEVPELAVASAVRSGARLEVAGTAPADLNSTLTVTFTATPESGPPINDAQDVEFTDGRFEAAFDLTDAARSATEPKVTVEYAGEDQYAARTVTADVTDG